MGIVKDKKVQTIFRIIELLVERKSIQSNDEQIARSLNCSTKTLSRYLEEIVSNYDHLVKVKKGKNNSYDLIETFSLYYSHIKKKINIFIISPSDVNDERAIAKEVCHELNELTNYEINAVLWEYNPMPYYENPQANINEALESSDIFIIILWNRMGTVVEGFEGAITKSKNVTGTQYEIEKILATKKESIFFYIKNEEKNISLTSDDGEEVWKQKKLLDSFLKDINIAEGSTKYSYHTFKESNEFKEKLPIHLSIELEKRYDINIKLPKKEKLTESLDINPVYYAGLYGFMVLIALIIALLIHDSKEVSETLKEATFIFMPIFLGVILLAIKYTLVNRSNFIKKSFKEMVYLLLRRFSFIMGLSLFLTLLGMTMLKTSINI